MTPLISTHDLTITVDAGEVVTDVSLALPAAGSLAIVGESGAGKTLLTRSLLGLLPAGVQIGSGGIRVGGRLMGSQADATWQEVRGRQLGYLPQDAQDGLNPLMTVGSHLTETVRAHGTHSRAQARQRAAELLAQIGLTPPQTWTRAHPHQLSGGMRQRVMLALAIAPGPDLLIADEPTSSLDPASRDRVVDLIVDLRRTRRMALLVVSHDFSVVRRLCEQMVVLYAGRIVECGPVADVLAAPRHPYTVGLLDTVLSPGRRRTQPPTSIPGTMPEVGARPIGCVFADRCPLVVPVCRELPAQRWVSPDHAVACHLVPGVIA